MSKSIVKRNSKDVPRKDKKVTLSKSNISSSSIVVSSHEDEESVKKTSALAFSILSKDDSEELVGMSAAAMDKKLQTVFQLQPMTDLKDASTLDFYVGAVYWAKQQGFNAQKLSGFFTVIYNLLGKIRDENLSFVNSMKFVYKSMIGIGVDLTSDIESGGLEFFNVKEAKAIGEYLNETIFKHYKLYEFMFQCSQDEEIVSSDLSVEVPLPATAPFPPPLDEGISEEVIAKFLTIPTPSMSTEATGELKPDQDNGQMTPIDVELPPEAADIFCKLTAEDVKNVVDEVTGQMLGSFQVGVEGKIRLQENNVISKINKMHNVLHEPSTEEEETSNF